MGSKKQRTGKKRRSVNNTAETVPQNPTRSNIKSSFSVGGRPLYTALYMIAAIVVLSVIFTIIINAVVTDMYLSNHPELANNTEALRNEVEAYINESPVYNIIMRIALNLAGVLVMTTLFGKIENDRFPSVGFINNGKRRVDIGMGFLFSFAAVFVAYNILAMIGYVKPTGSLAFNWIQLLWTVDIIFMCLFEEAFFRGYINYKLRGYNMRYAIIVSSVLFALYKGLPSVTPATYFTYLVMGAMLSYTSIKLKSAWFALSFRFMWTFTSAIILSIYADVIPGIIENSGLSASLLSGNRSGFENGFIATAVLIICYIVAKRLIESRNAPKQRRLHTDGTIR